MTVLTGSATVPAESPWWPDLELAPEPEVPPDPDADLLPVVRDEPDEWGGLSVYDLVDDVDRADLDRLLRLDEVEAADRLATADGELPAVRRRSWRGWLTAPTSMVSRSAWSRRSPSWPGSTRRCWMARRGWT